MGKFTGSISYIPLTISTQKLLNGSGQIVTYKELKKKCCGYSDMSS